MARERVTPVSREMKNLADKLSDLVEEKKKSGKKQKEIAEEIGISSGLLSSYCSAGQEASALNASKIAKYFDVSADWLLGLTDTRAIDTDMRSICEYTHLSPHAAKILHNELKDYKQNSIDVLFDSTEFRKVLRYLLLCIDASAAGRFMMHLFDEKDEAISEITSRVEELRQYSREHPDADFIEINKELFSCNSKILEYYKQKREQAIQTNRFGSTISGAMALQSKFDEAFDSDDNTFLSKLVNTWSINCKDAGESEVESYAYSCASRGFGNWLENIRIKTYGLADKEWENG